MPTYHTLHFLQLLIAVHSLAVAPAALSTLPPVLITSLSSCRAVPQGVDLLVREDGFG